MLLTHRNQWLALLALAAAPLAACSGSGDDDPEAAACGGPGVICTYLGTGKAGIDPEGTRPLQTRLYLPQDVTFGPDGNPYVIDWNNHRVRTIVDDRVYTVVGNGEIGEAPDGIATNTSLNHPTHVAFDLEGQMIVSAWHNSKVMRCDLESGKIVTVSGNGARTYSGDGGPAGAAERGVCRGELRRDSGKSPRERTLRPRARRLYWSH
jgi:hypothetical protein